MNQNQQPDDKDNDLNLKNHPTVEPQSTSRIGIPLFISIITLPLWFVIARRFFCFYHSGKMTHLSAWLLDNTNLEYETIVFWDFTNCTPLEYTVIFVAEFLVFFVLWKICSVSQPTEEQRKD